MHEALMDSSCPVCPWLEAPMLAIVSWPTIEESENNWDKVSEIDKIMIKQRKRFLAELERMSLKSSAALPDLEGSAITITWDFVEEDGDHFTVIKHGEKEIWREPAIYEGHERFAEVVELLKERYGERLADVIPASRSELYLYGDEIGAIGAAEGVRRRLLGVDLE
jgi:hypothetical protein